MFISYHINESFISENLYVYTYLQISGKHYIFKIKWDVISIKIIIDYLVFNQILSKAWYNVFNFFKYLNNQKGNMRDSCNKTKFSTLTFILWFLFENILLIMKNFRFYSSTKWNKSLLKLENVINLVLDSFIDKCNNNYLLWLFWNNYKIHLSNVMFTL